VVVDSHSLPLLVILTAILMAILTAILMVMLMVMLMAMLMAILMVTAKAVLHRYLVLLLPLLESAVWRLAMMRLQIPD
jgi:hypothetical protein